MKDCLDLEHCMTSATNTKSPKAVLGIKSFFIKMASRVASATSIYFCGSIRAGRQDVDLYQRIIQKLEKFGQVLTPFVGDKSITIKGSEREGGDKGIHDYDVGLLQRSDCKYFTVSTSVKSSF